MTDDEARDCAADLEQLEGQLWIKPVGFVSVDSLGEYLSGFQMPRGDPPDDLAYRCSWLLDTIQPGRNYCRKPAFYIPNIRAFMDWLEDSIPLTDEQRQELNVRMALAVTEGT